jgi:hypothetical protein
MLRTVLKISLGCLLIALAFPALSWAQAEGEFSSHAKVKLASLEQKMLQLTDRQSEIRANQDEIVEQLESLKIWIKKRR